MMRNIWASFFVAAAIGFLVLTPPDVAWWSSLYPQFRPGAVEQREAEQPPIRSWIVEQWMRWLDKTGWTGTNWEKEVQP